MVINKEILPQTNTNQHELSLRYRIASSWSLVWFVVIIFFISIHSAFGQSVHISWKGGENALRYEIEIEREEIDGFTSYLKESTTEKFLIVTLPPGNYSYKINSFDILDRPSTSTEWIYFEVRPLQIPEFVAEIPTPQPFIIEPETKKESEREPELKERKARDYFVNIGAAYMPAIFVYGEDKQESEFIGAAIRASINFPLVTDFYVGPELTSTWRDGIITMGVGVRFFRAIDNKDMGFVFRLGGEYLILLDDKELDSSLSLIGGISYILQITPLINIEIGVDLESNMSMPPNGLVRPWIGVGVRF